MITENIPAILSANIQLQSQILHRDFFHEFIIYFFEAIWNLALLTIMPVCVSSDILDFKYDTNAFEAQENFDELPDLWQFVTGPVNNLL
jgi:uncharacterized membrane protein YesL